MKWGEPEGVREWERKQHRRTPDSPKPVTIPDSPVLATRRSVRIVPVEAAEDCGRCKSELVRCVEGIRGWTIAARKPKRGEEGEREERILPKVERGEG